MRVVKVEPREDFKIWARFDEGTSGTIDLQDLAGRGVFGAWKDRTTFEHVHVNEAGAVEWPCDVDLCPDSLYLRLTGKRAEDLFPALRAVQSDA